MLNPYFTSNKGFLFLAMVIAATLFIIKEFRSKSEQQDPEPVDQDFPPQPKNTV